MSHRFENHRLVTAVLILTVFVCATELVLRIFDPEILKFAYNFRQVYRYHDRWYTDFEPNTTTLIKLDSTQGSPFFNFPITVNEYGFRTYDRILDHKILPQSEDRIIHAIGDSFTMGWGVNYEASYPAILEYLLPQHYRVINLGLNAYGTIGATEKSLSLFKQFPADVVVYLASKNDYDDDLSALKHSLKPPFIHNAYDVLNWFRINTYLASTPFALYWWARFRKSTDVTEEDFVSKKSFYRANKAKFSITDHDVTNNDSIGEVSKRALLKYNDFLTRKHVRFIVIAHGESEVSKDIYAFCQKNNIESYLLLVPAEFKLAKEGHFNQLGNQKLAEFVYQLIKEIHP